MSAARTVRARVTTVQVMLGSKISTGRAVAADGRALAFVGDWRAMISIGEALEAGEEVEVYLEFCEVLAWRRS